MTVMLAVHDLIDRWVGNGLLDESVAERLRNDLRSNPPGEGEGGGEGGGEGEASPGAVVVPRASDRMQAAVTAGLEALGYVGAALVIGAATFLLDIPSWPEAALLLLLAIAAGGCVTLVARLTPAQDGQGARLATVVGTAGLSSLGGFLGLLLLPDCLGGCDWFAERVPPLVVAIPVTVAAAALYRRVQNALTHFWVGGGTATVLVLLAMSFFSPTNRSYRSEEVVTALLLLPAAWAWTWASETGRLTPAWVGTLGASAVAVGSVVTLANFDPFTSSNDLVPIALLAFGAAYVSAGVTLSLWRLTTIGAFVLVWAVPWTLNDVFGLSETATALVLLPVGIAMMAFVGRRMIDR